MECLEPGGLVDIMAHSAVRASQVLDSMPHRLEVVHLVPLQAGFLDTDGICLEGCYCPYECAALSVPVLERKAIDVGGNDAEVLGLLLGMHDVSIFVVVTDR
jgi:hypothetical protein